MSPNEVILRDYIERLRGYRSYRELAQRLDIDYTYLWRLAKGENTNPSDEVLEKLGLRKEVRYFRL